MNIPNLLNMFGKNGGVTHEEIQQSLSRTKFSDFLPWNFYDPETNLYKNTDESEGFLWECAPLAFAGTKTHSTLENMLNYPFPTGTVLQSILYADNNIDPFLDAFRAAGKRSSPLIEKTTDYFCEFLKQGTSGLDKLSGMPIRNFRHFECLKLPTHTNPLSSSQLTDIKNMMAENLSGASLCPEQLSPRLLIDWMWRLFNQKPSLAGGHYSEGMPIRKQIISAETPIEDLGTSLKIGDYYFKCITPKVFPSTIDSLITHGLFGSFLGGDFDNDQIKTPFLFTLNIIFDDLKPELHKKCNLILLQKGVGSMARSLFRKQEEYQWATDELEKGTKFLRIIPALWVWHKEEQMAAEGIERIKRIWEGAQFVMQKDRNILTSLFIGSLPFGFYLNKKNIDLLERDFIAPTNAIASFMPVQGDFSGIGKPVLSYVGRKGQVCGIDLFDKRAPNHNFYLGARSGEGKSFLINDVCLKYYKAGAKIRIADLGGSYNKLTKMVNGVYLDFDKYSEVCLNPFSNVGDFDDDLSVIAAIILQMIYSATGSVPKDDAESIMTLIKYATTWAYYEQPQKHNHIDLVFLYLKTFPEQEKNSDFNQPHLIDLAKRLAFNLTEFTSKGVYGKWVNGKSTLDISNDDFVVLELQNLKPQKELFKVVTLQIVNAITQDLYLSKTYRQSLNIFEEASQFLGEEGGDLDSLQQVIEGGYRRARKHGGSFGVVTQSPLDLYNFGKVGDVIRANSAFKFYLQSSDFDQAHKLNLIDLDPFTFKLLKTTASKKPFYSEIFFDTPLSKGVGRLIVDKFLYYINSSEKHEVAEIEEMVAQGKTYAEAIETMVFKYAA